MKVNDAVEELELVLGNREFLAYRGGTVILGNTTAGCVLLFPLICLGHQI